MRKLGIVITVACVLGLAALAYLAFVVPKWVNEANEAGSTLNVMEVFLYNLSQIATSFGLVIGPLLLVGAIAGFVLAGKGDGKKKS